MALALGALGQAERRFRIILIFGLFEFMVPLLGIWLGSAAAEALDMQTNLAGAILLIGMGLVAFMGGIRNKSKDEKLARLMTRWGGLVFLAFNLSIDNLVVGFSLGLGRVEPLAVAGTIALFSVAFTWTGLHLGRESRRNWERAAKVGAGLLLIVLGAATGLGWL